MSVRGALEAFVADLSYADGRAVMRIAGAVDPKSDPSSYWNGRGRPRFANELATDGVSAETIARALAVVDDGLGDPVSLAAILEDLRRRIT